MDERKEQPEEKLEERSEEQVGGGPEMPGGDTELSNIPGETRESGPRQTDTRSALPIDVEE